jgi:hypothetical protein
VLVASVDAVSTHVRSGRIAARVLWGAGTWGVPPEWAPREEGGAARDAPHRLGRSDLTYGKGQETAPYRVYLQLEAPVDPEVEIEVGTIFEQTSLNGVQTLATASSRQITVHPGYTASLLIDAWCLDRNLSPPSGEGVFGEPGADPPAHRREGGHGHPSSNHPCRPPPRGVLPVVVAKRLTRHASDQPTRPNA